MKVAHPPLPGRDRRAAWHPAAPGADRLRSPRSVVVIGGGIAGIAASTALAERGATVTLLEASPRLGGRVSSWRASGDRSMSRGFHAFFKQYYNLRALLRRADPSLTALRPVEDYPLQRADGLVDSFAHVPKSPPWNLLGFILRSPAFTARSVARVDFRAALGLLRVRFPDTYNAYDGESAADFLDRLRFPPGARDLALRVFARSFFADPRDFAAGELVAMFHTYFLGSAEGLTFDVPGDDYDTALWQPQAHNLSTLGVEVRTGSPALRISFQEGGATVSTDMETFHADAAVIAADPCTARRLIAEMDGVHSIQWREAVAATRNAPPFAVVRLWLDSPMRRDRPAFLGTSGYGPLDNISLLDRFEATAAAWSSAHRGSVVELHAYACDPETATHAGPRQALVARLESELHRAYPETASARALHAEVLIRDDCPLIAPDGWRRRPGVSSPVPGLVLAGDWVRCDYPVALMERAATTGILAANSLLERWETRGHGLWTAPMKGMLATRR